MSAVSAGIAGKDAQLDTASRAEIFALGNPAANSSSFSIMIHQAGLQRKWVYCATTGDEFYNRFVSIWVLHQSEEFHKVILCDPSRAICFSVRGRRTISCNHLIQSMCSQNVPWIWHDSTSVVCFIESAEQLSMRRLLTVSSSDSQSKLGDAGYALA